MPYLLSKPDGHIISIFKSLRLKCEKIISNYPLSIIQISVCVEIAKSGQHHLQSVVIVPIAFHDSYFSLSPSVNHSVQLIFCIYF